MGDYDLSYPIVCYHIAIEIRMGLYEAELNKGEHLTEKEYERVRQEVMDKMYEAYKGILF